MEPIEVFLSGLAVLFLVIPPAVFVMTVLAFALALSRVVRVLFTVTGLCTGCWFAFADFLTRALRGL